jgi:hypothetical protein
MARDKGNFYEASDWFKEALQINQVSGIDLVSEIFFFYLSKSVCQFSGCDVSRNHGISGFSGLFYLCLTC